MKIFFFDHTQSCVGVFFDVFHCCETTSSKAHFQWKEEPEVTWCEVWGIGRVWHNRNVVSGRELLNFHSRVTGSIMTVQLFLAKNNIPIVPQPPYSPDLAPSDFWLKMGLRGRRFAMVEDIKQNADARLRAIKKDDFHRCYNNWIDRWNKCLCAEGKYFEGN
jgi:hypothetical protein